MSQHDSAPLPTVVQLNIYRQQNGRFEYLLLKRIDHDTQFWQVITEPVAGHSTIADTLKQAEEQQIGVRGFKRLTHEMYSYEWYAHGERGRDIVFAAELDPATTIYLDHSRYDDFAWLPFEEAVQRLKWNGNKEALRQLHAHLQAERFDNPPTPTTGLYHTSPPAGTGQQANSAPRTGPYGPNVPKRLPDRPEDRPATIDDDESSTSAFYL